MFIGLTGPICAGKGEVRKILGELGFTECFSLSDIIRYELKMRDMPDDRKSLQNIGDELRKLFGEQVLAERVCLLFNSDRGVVDSIRHPVEVDCLRFNLDNFVLIGVTASQKTRFNRLVSRGRQGDVLDFDGFVKSDNKELLGEGSGQRVNDCLSMCNFVIENEGSLDDLRRKIVNVISSIHQ